MLLLLNRIALAVSDTFNIQFWQPSNKKERCSTNEVLLKSGGLSRWGQNLYSSLNSIPTNRYVCSFSKLQAYMLTIKWEPIKCDVKYVGDNHIYPRIQLFLNKYKANWQALKKKLHWKSWNIAPIFKQLTLCHATICCCQILSCNFWDGESLKCQFLCFRLHKHEYLAASWRQHYGLSDLTIMRRQLCRQNTGCWLWL